MKNIKKLAFKILTFLIVFTALFTIGSKVNAAAETIQLGPAKQAGKYIAGVTFSYKFTTDGKYLYCVNNNKNTAQNITADLVKQNSVIDGGIVYILKNGYPEKSITGNADKDYYITQTAIWWYLDETTGSMNLGDYFKVSGSDPENMRPLVKNLVQEGIKHRNDPYGIGDVKFAITTSDTNMTLSGEYYVSKEITVTESQNVSEVKVTVEGAPEGTIIEVADQAINSTSTTINPSNKFRIKVPAKAVTGTELAIKVVATASGVTQYAAYEYHPRNDNMQNVALLEKGNKDVTASLTFDISSSKVTIEKIDSVTKQPLAGAVLILKNEAGKELTRWTSTTKAHVIKNLPNGTYYIQEDSAPNGYKLNTNCTKFTITDKNRNIKVNFENAPEKIVVNITKVDQSTREPLAGAVLVIKDANGEIIYKFTSTTASEVITDIGKGTYTLSEVSAPEGYILNTNVITFTIDDDHLSHQIIFENAKETYVPDTASVSSMLLAVLGIAITGFGIEFVIKNGQKA